MFLQQQDQRYGYQDHPGLLYSGTYDTDKKSSSLPIHKSSSESVIRHSSSVTPPPAAQPKVRDLLFFIIIADLLSEFHVDEFIHRVIRLINN